MINEKSPNDNKAERSSEIKRLNMRILFCGLVLIYCCEGAAFYPTTGIAISRRPVIATTSATTNSAEIIKTTSTKITTTVPVQDDYAEEPSETPNASISEPVIATTPQASSASDPTDYSTVWPTRWRPRRRFGDQSEASPQFLTNWKLTFTLLIGAILL